MFLIHPANSNELANYLKEKNRMAEGETIVNISKAGEGNMNCVLRVEFGKSKIIIKQSRGYVEKYPQIAAPANRSIIEGLFYKKTSSQIIISQMMPRLIGMDEENNIIVLEDLGIANDYSFLYDLEKLLSDEELTSLVSWLNALHTQIKRAEGDIALSNMEMRLLNHEHIFNFPLKNDSWFDLDTVQPGLQAISLPFKNDFHFKKKVEYLGNIYLSEGEYLLHGDFYPGSWLKTVAGIKIIDAEFCFYGLREFDLGVMLAHLYLTKHDEKILQKIKNSYPSFHELSMDILNGFTGTEIMRRLIGLAQLPVKLNLAEKELLLNKAYELIMK
jgi:5-methylthioribose kinase